MKRPRPHRCIPSGSTDWQGRDICTCGQVETAAVHAVDREKEEQAALVDARKLGEGVADAH